MQQITLLFTILLLSTGCTQKNTETATITPPQETASIDSVQPENIGPDSTALSSTSNFPPLTGRIVDEANMIDDTREKALQQQLADFETQTTNQLVVAVLTTINNRDPLEYATELGSLWGIGQKDKNNGILLLVAQKEQQMSIAVGSGLEAVLTDSICNQIITEIAIPEFKKGDFTTGIELSCAGIMNRLK